jgi:hypothetical protein
MGWVVQTDDAFATEFAAFAPGVQEEIAALVRLLQQFGAAFAFDPARKAILLVAGDKSGVSEQRFYKTLIRTADERFTAHLKRLKEK